MKNGQNGMSAIQSIIQPVTIDTILNNNGQGFIQYSKIYCIMSYNFCKILN